MPAAPAPMIRTSMPIQHQSGGRENSSPTTPSPSSVNLKQIARGPRGPEAGICSSIGNLEPASVPTGLRLALGTRAETHRLPDARLDREAPLALQAAQMRQRLADGEADLRQLPGGAREEHLRRLIGRQR